jgi:hypothetical protein
VIANDDERDVVFLGESRQADGDLPGERRRAVEHHQVEGAAAEEDVGAPGAPVGARWADDPEAAAGSRVSPLAWGECPRTVDQGYPPARIDGAQHQLPDECGAAAAARALDFCQPPAGQPTVRQRAIQPGDARGNGTGIAGPRGWENRRQLLAERGNRQGRRPKSEIRRQNG